MRKYLLFCLLIAFSLVSIETNGQICTPDPAYAGADVGVFPVPYDPPNNSPDTAGIYKDACVGEPYTFNFTIVVPDSIDIPGFGTIDLASVQLTNIANLPPGVTYACEPATCFFPDQNSGCAVLQGTPTMVGVFPLLISVVVNGAIPLNFPDAGLAPGTYDLTVLPSSDPFCTSGVIETELNESIAISQNSPNPFTGVTSITLDVKKPQALIFTVVDIYGQELHKKVLNLNTGREVINYDASKLESGVYFYTFNDGKRSITKKMVVTN